MLALVGVGKVQDVAVVVGERAPGGDGCGVAGQPVVEFGDDPVVPGVGVVGMLVQGAAAQDDGRARVAVLRKGVHEVVPWIQASGEGPWVTFKGVGNGVGMAFADEEGADVRFARALGDAGCVVEGAGLQDLLRGGVAKTLTEEVDVLAGGTLHDLGATQAFDGFVVRAVHGPSTSQRPGLVDGAVREVVEHREVSLRPLEIVVVKVQAGKGDDLAGTEVVTVHGCQVGVDITPPRMDGLDHFGVGVPLPILHLEDVRGLCGNVHDQRRGGGVGEVFGKQLQGHGRRAHLVALAQHGHGRHW